MLDQVTLRCLLCIMVNVMRKTISIGQRILQEFSPSKKILKANS